MTIGERIKNRRVELGLSVEELARLLGKNRATIYRYESDEIENLPIKEVLGGSSATCLPPYLPPSPPLFTPGPFLSQFVGIIFDKSVDLNEIKVYT